MYTEYFGLQEPPFHITPDPKFIFASKAYRDGISNMLYGLQMRKGFLALIGEVGMGKTTLYRFLLEKLGQEYDTAVVLNPLLTQKQLIASVLHDFEVPAPTESVTAAGLVSRLNRFLESENEKDRIPLLIVDEAHQLSEPLLEELRILSNFETNRQKLLQILMVGQPELLQKLRSPRLRQLNQRINVRYCLGALDRAETAQYIQHRLSIAGSKGDIVFSPNAVRLIHRLSRGAPRVVNQICDRALLSAFVQESRKVGKNHVKEARVSLDGGCKLSPFSIPSSADSGFFRSRLTQRLRLHKLSLEPRVGANT